MKFRHEYKHIINMSDRIQLSSRLSKLFTNDVNCDCNGKYYVKSLYFDNYMDKALREKVDGINCREKFRIRYYNTDLQFIRLEKKSKINGLCSKESALLTYDECVNILEGNYDFLLKDDCILKKELYSKMKYQLIRPKCIVGYSREAFIYAPGNVRITLDYDISGSNDIKNFLSSGLSLLNLYHPSILEVKWDEFLPEIVRNAVQMQCRQSSAFSKYASVRF